MNRIYRSIWNEALSAWVAVSEITKARGNRSANRRKLLATGLLICTSSALALPTGEQLIAGQANVSIANAEQMQIQQNSQQAIINWQGFSIAPNEAVNIQQPNANAALLNRVVGQDASQIQGQLNANGQVYLVNPNGVAFSKTAQVDVGALVASTHTISTADFMAGKNHFTQESAKSTIENHGTINTANGGVVALIGESVTNTGTINTPKGTSALIAGKTVDLDFQGNGLVEVKVSEAALNVQISNKGVIQADGGRVVLSAKAAGQLIDTVINQEGIVQAQGLVERNGEIILDGGEHGTVKISGELNARSSNFGLNSSTTGGNINITGQQIAMQNGAKLTASGNTGGGTITIGDKQTTQQTTIEQDASVSAQTLNSGKAGTIKIVANMDNGLVKVDGLLDASASKNGDGGFIDTSAAHVKVSDSAKISTKANNGKTGKWLIDPTDYTIAASGGDITGVNLANYLLTSNVELQTLATGSTGQGDIFVNDAVTWNNLNTLSLTAHRNINLNAAINAVGGGNVSLRADSLATGTGTVLFANNGHITANNGAAVTFYYNPINYADAATQSGRLGNPYSSKVTLNTGSTMMSYMLVNDVNQLQAMNTNLTGNYALGKDIDASATIGWNGGAGFSPVGGKDDIDAFRIIGISNTGFLTVGGKMSPTDYFFGNFNGLGHTITGLTINRPTNDNVGLFGVIQGGTISNIGLVNVSIVGHNVGALAGKVISGNVSNAYATGNVHGGIDVGGLIGNNSGNISNAYTTNNVYGDTNFGTGCLAVGGLVGNNSGNISNAYATGNVYGAVSIGGLVGSNSGNISNVYATGNIFDGFFANGGLVGVNEGNGNISNAYATGNVYSFYEVGGLVGDNYGNINNAYAMGNVYGDSSGVGGLVGNNYGNINNAYAMGKVSGTRGTGGLVGADYNNRINNSYWNTTTSAMVTSAGGTGLTDAQMKQQASFSGWDFTNIWQINKGISYPTLKAFDQQIVAPVIPTPLVILTPTVIVPTIVEPIPVQPVDSVTLDEPILTPVQSIAPLIFDEPILPPVQLIDSLTLNQLMTQFSSIQTSTTFADWYQQQRLAKYNKEIEANFEQYKSLGYILKN